MNSKEKDKVYLLYSRDKKLYLSLDFDHVYIWTKNKRYITEDVYNTLDPATITMYDLDVSEYTLTLNTFTITI